jgi:transposase
MRIQGSNAAADARRARGLSLLAEGQTCQQVAAQVGVSKRTVERWRQEASSGVIRQRKKPGPRVRLSAKQIRKLKRGDMPMARITGRLTASHT